MKKLFYIIRTIIIAFLLWVVVSSSVENIKINILIDNFTSQGVYQGDISTYQNKIYYVYKSDDYDSFEVINDKTYPGREGDVIVGLKSAVTDVPFVDPAITFLFGGHAAFATWNYEDQNITMDNSMCIETTGNEESDNNIVQTDIRSYWDDLNYRTEYIGLRVKTSLDNKIIAFNECVSMMNQKYNYSFIFNQKNQSYCSDLISKAYGKVGVNLNNDLLGTTVQDLIVSNNTYITIYKIVKNDVSYTYYLKSID